MAESFTGFAVAIHRQIVRMDSILGKILGNGFVSTRAGLQFFLHFGLDRVALKSSIVVPRNVRGAMSQGRNSVFLG
jgi:hypothetical protein